MTKTEIAKSVGFAVLGGATAAIATAIPLVDDGVLLSEGLSITLAGLVGTGLTALPGVRRNRATPNDPA
jgi:hypothetical protein